MRKSKPVTPSTTSPTFNPPPRIYTLSSTPIRCRLFRFPDWTPLFSSQSPHRTCPRYCTLPLSNRLTPTPRVQLRSPFSRSGFGFPNSVRISGFRSGVKGGLVFLGQSKPLPVLPTPSPYPLSACSKIKALSQSPITRNLHWSGILRLLLDRLHAKLLHSGDGRNIGTYRERILAELIP
nr:hypothetical protein Iba_chr13bCG7790 [Ipomoea batatas]